MKTRAHYKEVTERYLNSPRLQSMGGFDASEELGVSESFIVKLRTDHGLSEKRAPRGLTELYPFPAEVVENNTLLRAWR